MAEDKYYDEFVDVQMPRKLAIKLKHILAQNPDADIEDVVRCEKCKQFMEYADGIQSVEGANGDCFIRMMNSIYKQFCGVKYNDFCSYGERDENK